MSVKTEIWSGRVYSKIQIATDGSFLSPIEDVSGKIVPATGEKAAVLHMVELKSRVKTLINNTTYPIPTNNFEDDDIPISLDKFDTENFAVSDDELHAVSYPKIDEVTKASNNGLIEDILTRSAWRLAPNGNSDKSPILGTSGEAGTDGFKKMTRKDLLSLKRKFDSMKVPTSGRVLVLCTQHANDIIEDATDKFNQALYFDANTGKLSVPLYGFTIYEHVNNPYFGTSDLKKLAYGALPTADHIQGSILYSAPYCLKAMDKVKMYYASAESNPSMRRTEMGFKTYQIARPVFEDFYIGAVVSGK